MVTKTYIVSMHCPSCEMLLEGLDELPGVESVEADYRTQRLIVTFDPGIVPEDYLLQMIAKEGYEAKTATL